MRTEKEVDQIIEEMIEKNKGAYITQGVAFNKKCPRQMKLLKKSLMYSNSFSGLIKEMLAISFNNGEEVSSPNTPQISKINTENRDVNSWI